MAKRTTTTKKFRSSGDVTARPCESRASDAKRVGRFFFVLTSHPPGQRSWTIYDRHTHREITRARNPYLINRLCLALNLPQCEPPPRPT